MSSGTRLRILFAAVALMGLASACYRDPREQVMIKPDHRHWKLANPEPSKRDFKGINDRHRILMAIFDSGIDYDHPMLVPNVHFDLDAAGKPAGLGKDFLAFDDWSHYRVVDTSLYPLEERSREFREDIEKDESAETWNEKIRERLGPVECRQRALEKIDRSGKLGLKDYVGVYRDPGLDESGEHTHGTHVAGLMTYDRPDFGLISYRIVPYHLDKAQKKQEKLAQADIWTKYFEESLEHAAARGVKIVNLSVGATLECPGETNTAVGLRAYREFLLKKKLLADDMAARMRAHPGILFVAAAGNDSGFTDDDCRVQAPCGIGAPNLVCVGALNSEARRTRFTNLEFTRDRPTVFAPGFDILSLKPADTCPELNDLISSIQAGGTPLCEYDRARGNWVESEKSRKRFEKSIRAIAASCKDRANLLTRMSGTSMATPLVTHMAAEVWVERPEIKEAAAIIPLVIERFRKSLPADPEARRGIPSDSLSPAVPSWYGHGGFFSAGAGTWSEPGAESVQIQASDGSRLDLKLTRTMGVRSGRAR
jgi:subtilisin family serine protease